MAQWERYLTLQTSVSLPVWCGDHTHLALLYEDEATEATSVDPSTGCLLAPTGGTFVKDQCPRLISKDSDPVESSQALSLLVVVV